MGHKRGTAIAIGSLLFLAVTPIAWAEKPNIILIVADDFGYECVGANGGTSYSTPHLDRLAATGMRFKHCYAQPLCTPSRVQLMTGRYNVRNYRRFGELHPGETTFAELLKQEGYATCIVGKWQLGGGFQGPKRFGFDEYCLWQLTRRPPRYANPGLEINGHEKNFSRGEYGPDLVSNYALDFIAKHKNGPFLLYYPMMLTHDPFQPTPDSPDWDPKAVGENVHQHARHFGEMVHYMDKLIGKLVAKLNESGLRERTLILFTGDNGTGHRIQSNMGSLTIPGGKGEMTDAGMRVPLIANWPGTVPDGRTCDDLVDTTDFLRTICQAAGANLAPGKLVDGRSFLPQLKGEAGSPRTWIYSWYAPNQGRIDVPREFARNHRYKLWRDGTLSEIDAARYEEWKLDENDLKPEAVAARKELQFVLDRFANVRPADLDQR